MKDAGKSFRHDGKHGGAQVVRSDRKSVTGMSGALKKGGHGGKFTWFGHGYSRSELDRFENEAVDFNDPNFDEKRAGHDQ